MSTTLRHATIVAVILIWALAERHLEAYEDNALVSAPATSDRGQPADIVPKKLCSAYTYLAFNGSTYGITVSIQHIPGNPILGLEHKPF
jgi:hypothetical protein